MKVLWVLQISSFVEVSGHISEDITMKDRWDTHQGRRLDSFRPYLRRHHNESLSGVVTE